jgi:hypothetical protein
VNDSGTFDDCRLGRETRLGATFLEETNTKIVYRVRLNPKALISPE